MVLDQLLPHWPALGAQKERAAAFFEHAALTGQPKRASKRARAPSRNGRALTPSPSPSGGSSGGGGGGGGRGGGGGAGGGGEGAGDEAAARVPIRRPKAVRAGEGEERINQSVRRPKAAKAVPES